MRRILALSTMVISALLISATPGAAAPAQQGGTPGSHTRRPSPWKLVPDGDFTFEAGEVCAFAVRNDIVRDGDWVSTFERYPDGSPRREVIVGPLVYRVTNTVNGKSVVRNFGGTTEALHREDGATVYQAIGGIAIGIHRDRDPHPPGYYLNTGYTELEIAANDVHRILVSVGPVENLCETLA